MPWKLDVGSEINIILGSPGAITLDEDNSAIGVEDTFGGFHWAPRSQLRECLRMISEIRKSANLKTEESAYP
jgi:hypothetical protein